MKSMTKKERTELLSNIIEMKPPSWLTPEIYSKYNSNREHLSKSVKPKDIICDMFPNINKMSDFDPDPTHGSFSFSHSTEPLVDLYNENRIVSDPSSGQDPKRYTASNLKQASNHAARHWGWKSNHDTTNGHANSQWIQYGTFNLIQYPNNETVLEPCDVEHRFWGLVGFPLDLVPIDYDEPLYFYNRNLPEVYDGVVGKMFNRIQVNGMYLSDIVEAAKEVGCHKTNADILKTHFYSNNFKFTILPFYSKPRCEKYFREVNKSSIKTPPQLFHASSEPIMYWAKKFSSPKCVNFLPMESKFHPLYELMKESDRVRLEGLMYTFLIAGFIDNGYKPVATSDEKIITKYDGASGYYNNFQSEAFKVSIIRTLDFLYSLISKLDNPKMSRQMIQQLLLTQKYLTEEGYVIQDKDLFINSFVKWYNKTQETTDGDTTPFGKWVRGASEKYQNSAFYKKTKLDFLNRLRDDNQLREKGIVISSLNLNRAFSEDVILDTLEENNGKDIDGTTLYTKPVGGHIISDFELARMSDDQRDQAFMEEGLGDKFIFDKNCRAMSVYHNHRMGVLRLSEYLKIINESDNTVREDRSKKYKLIVNKVIIKAA